MATLIHGKRACLISVQNDTDYPACIDAWNVYYGDCTCGKNFTVKPHETKLFAARSTALLAGSEGCVYFKCDDERMSVYWDVPLSGSNDYCCKNTHSGHQKFHISYKSYGNKHAKMYVKIELSQAERERRERREQERIQKERLRKKKIEDEKKKKIQLEKERERRRIAKKLREEKKLINRVKKETVNISESVATVLYDAAIAAKDKLNDEKFQEAVRENTKSTTTAIYDLGSYGYNAAKDKVTDEEFQETVRENTKLAATAMYGWGSYGLKKLFDGLSYGANALRAKPEPKPEPSPELPEPKTGLNDYHISYISWRIEPLHNAAQYVNGKHSKVYVIFDVKGIDTKWSLPQIPFAVERLQGGIFIVQKKDIDLNRNPKLQSYECNLKDGALNEINLRDFLIKCNEINTRYQLDNNDCHCFAQDMWYHCIPKIIAQKPNEWLTSIGKVANSKLPKLKASKSKQMSIKELDPRKKRQDETFEDVEQNILDVLKKWDS
eukprot:276710_1